MTGNAICSDGFVSSTLYSQTDECQSSCIRPVVSYVAGVPCDYDDAVLALPSSQYNPSDSAGLVNACKQAIIAYKQSLVIAKLP